MKHNRPYAWLVAIAITCTSQTACSLDSYEPEKPFVTCPVDAARLYAVTRGSIASAEEALFTEDDIEWFDVNTRELRFTPTATPLAEKLNPCEDVEFKINGTSLFLAANLVNPLVSRTYLDLVLYEEFTWLDGEKVQVGYFLYDCYPSQFIDAEQTALNRAQRAMQWELFTSYLERIGKLRK